MDIIDERAERANQFARGQEDVVHIDYRNRKAKVEEKKRLKRLAKIDAKNRRTA